MRGLLYMQVKTNYLCLSRAAANKTTSFKPVVAWLLYSEVCSIIQLDEENYSY